MVDACQDFFSWSYDPQVPTDQVWVVSGDQVVKIVNVRFEDELDYLWEQRD